MFLIKSKLKFIVILSLLTLIVFVSTISITSTIKVISKEKLIEPFIKIVHATSDTVEDANEQTAQKIIKVNMADVSKLINNSHSNAITNSTSSLTAERERLAEEERIRKEEEQKRLEEEARIREEERQKELVYNLTEAGEKGVYQNYAYSFFEDYGWTVDDYSALITLWNRESNWNPSATNSSSGAHGIPQALPASKMASEGSDYYTNYETQIRWGLKYIANRYGSPSNALAHSYAYNWY